MDWLICIAIAVLSSSAIVFIDNYISDYHFKGKNAAAQKSFFRLPFIIIGAICIITGGINFEIVPFYFYLIFILSGFINTIASIFYYKALEIADSTDFGVFAQLSPIFYLIFGWLLLGQTITIYHLIAFLIIIIAPILIVATTKKRSRHLKLKAILFVTANTLIAAFSSVIFVKFNTPEMNFTTEMGLLFIGQGIGNVVIILANPKWKKRYKYVAKTNKDKIYYPLFGTLILNIVNKFARNLALVLAPSVALVSAITDSARPIVIFFFGLLFTLLWPRFGRERLKRRTVLAHLLATILVALGIYLIKT